MSNDDAVIGIPVNYVDFASYLPDHATKGSFYPESEITEPLAPDKSDIWLVHPGLF